MPTTPFQRRQRVAIADVHPLFRSGLIQCLHSQPDLTPCGEAANAAELLALARQALPDIIITEMPLPGRAGLELLRDLAALAPHRPTLVVSSHDECLHAERALRAGARGYLMKSAPPAQILLAIRQVLSGRIAVSHAMAERLLESVATRRRARSSTSPIESLTDREFEVFQLIGYGLPTREIAARLHISPKTVEVHRGHLREKLALRTSAALVHHAIRWADLEEHPDNGADASTRMA